MVLIMTIPVLMLLLLIRLALVLLLIHVVLLLLLLVILIKIMPTKLLPISNLGHDGHHCRAPLRFSGACPCLQPTRVAAAAL